MIHSNLIGDNMKKTIIGTVVILAMLCSLTACANNQPQQNTERETEITNTEPSAEEKNNELTDDSNNNSFSNNAPASVLITCLEMEPNTNLDTTRASWSMTEGVTFIF